MAAWDAPLPRSKIQSMKRAILSLRCAFLAGVLALTLRPQEPATSAKPAATSVTVEENIPYASDHGYDLRLDVYEPAGPRIPTHPAVVLIHGGAWMSLDKGTMRGMGQLLARSGFVAFSVDYRLFQDNANRWPAQLDDVQRAVRWVRANAAKYGVDPVRIGAYGHSAGAQLAALLGMEDTRDNSDRALAAYSSRVQAVVDVSGPTDFTTNRDPGGAAFLASFLGTSYEKNPQAWREASPAFHVSKGDAPFLIVHGAADESVAISQAEELFQKTAIRRSARLFRESERRPHLSNSRSARGIGTPYRRFL